ncbi:Putative rRNA methylase [Anaerosphaera aminiphila DSM 21120]|uniref:Putative rRNA methylase n=1 Tax=Anaerosphaera aminiphila DSM 21120 TaxID=1120995 RepID=A0A1M5P9P3_9FIRM|nr:class I SAM-dependent methyltransferase [Anaerosphaera aminiphila]SHG97963.1 Putative rRNA methylase [Anaerosphaera aminiphila DSM 21120]
MRPVKFNYREIIDEVLENMDLKDKVCLDCTSGRGNDSLNIISKIGDNGFLYAYDIQKEAVEDTTELLKSNGYSNFKIFNKSHTNIDIDISCELELVIFNLGYLPKSNKSITTKKNTTIEALDKAIPLLSKSGVIIVVSYLGHEYSFEEREAVDSYLKRLDQNNFLVEKREFYNQVNNPPIVFLVGRR